MPCLIYLSNFKMSLSEKNMTVRQKVTDCQKFQILSVTHGSDRPNIPELPKKISHRLHHPIESYGHFSLPNFVKKWQKNP